MIHPYHGLHRAGASWGTPDARISSHRRIARFAITGGLAGLLQITLLKLMLDGGLRPLPANASAFLLAAQFNFFMSTLFTWRDRRPERALGRRWVAFHGSIAGMAVVNLLVFGATRLVLPDLAASAAGIAAGACGNYMLGDRLVFRSPRLEVSQREGEAQRMPAA